MNEKIKELAKLSRLDADQIMCEILCYDYTSIDEKNLNNAWVAIPIETRYEVTEYIEQMQERFAELLIRECIAICQDMDGEDNIDAKSSRQDCAVEIREHFGVEE